jgi:hypothetical protein
MCRTPLRSCAARATFGPVLPTLGQAAVYSVTAATTAGCSGMAEARPVEHLSERSLHLLAYPEQLEGELAERAQIIGELSIANDIVRRRHAPCASIARR